MAQKICGTCKYCYYKEQKGRYEGKPPKTGYCYGNPPGQGRLRPTTNMSDNACSLYAEIAKGQSNLIQYPTNNVEEL